MKPILQDLFSPLDEVEREWLRKPMTVILSIPLLIISIPFGILDYWHTCWKEFCVPCWNGKE